MKTKQVEMVKQRSRRSDHTASPRCEIEGAISQIKAGGETTKWSVTQVKRWNYKGGQLWNKRDGPRRRAGNVNGDRKNTVWIRARVPKAFFKWFDQRLKSEWQDRELLSRCQFEEI